MDEENVFSYQEDHEWVKEEIANKDKSCCSHLLKLVSSYLTNCIMMAVLNILGYFCKVNLILYEAYYSDLDYESYHHPEGAVEVIVHIFKDPHSKERKDRLDKSLDYVLCRDIEVSLIISEMIESRSGSV